MTEGTTEPNWVRRVANKLGGEAGTWVLLKHPGPPALAAVQDAVSEANAAVPTDSTVGSFVTTTRHGEAVLVHCHGAMQDTTTTWVTALNQALQEGGLSVTGSIMRSQRTGEDDSVELRSHLFPAVFIGYQLETYHPLTRSFNGWQVDQATTRRLADRYVEWLSTIETGTTWAYTQTNAPVALDRAAEFLRATAAISPFGKKVKRVAEDRMPTLIVTLRQLGQAVTQECDLSLTWRQRLERQTARLCADADVMDVGLIKTASSIAGDWTGLSMRREPHIHKPVRLPLDYERNRHLWDEYVIDAAGVQLLTDKHLTHAHDLSDWTVEEVAPDRFLVTARDLESWYAGPVAQPETVERARRDFGDMILSWDTILANPGPYTVTSPTVVGR